MAIKSRLSRFLSSGADLEAHVPATTERPNYVTAFLGTIVVAAAMGAAATPAEAADKEQAAKTAVPAELAERFHSVLKTPLKLADVPAADALAMVEASEWAKRYLHEGRASHGIAVHLLTPGDAPEHPNKSGSIQHNNLCAIHHIRTAPPGEKLNLPQDSTRLRKAAMIFESTHCMMMDAITPNGFRQSNTVMEGVIASAQQQIIGRQKAQEQAGKPDGTKRNPALYEDAIEAMPKPKVQIEAADAKHSYADLMLGHKYRMHITAHAGDAMAVLTIANRDGKDEARKTLAELQKVRAERDPDSVRDTRATLSKLGTILDRDSGAYDDDRAIVATSLRLAAEGARATFPSLLSKQELLQTQRPAFREAVKQVRFGIGDVVNAFEDGAVPNAAAYLITKRVHTPLPVEDSRNPEGTIGKAVEVMASFYRHAKEKITSDKQEHRQAIDKHVTDQQASLQLELLGAARKVSAGAAKSQADRVTSLLGEQPNPFANGASPRKPR